MLSHETPYRVCYADVDRMGYVYHGHYLRLFEIGRNEMIRAIYGSYADMEASGYMLPCRNAEVEYLQPALFDDLLTIRSIVEEPPRVRFTIGAEVYNAAGSLLTRGKVTLVFADTRTGRPRRAPPELVQRIQQGLEQSAR
jgi:acyl-CoA thioester hydrolase